MSINKVILTGRLTRDPEVRTTQSGKSVAMFTVAVDDGWGDNKKAYFPNVVVWGKAADSCGKCLTKGSKVGIVGKLTTRSYDDKDGKKVYVTEVIADMYGGVEFLDSRKDNNGDGYQYKAGSETIADEDIPF